MKKAIAIAAVLAAFSCSTGVPTSERASELIAAIPDHGIAEGSKTCFTADYYALLEEAWNIPTDYIEGIGSEEWLYYFISGNGDTDCNEHPAIESITGEEIIFTYLGQHHTISLAKENCQWVTADFDGTKKQLEEYISTQRRFFRSKEWTERLTEFSPENAETSRKDVETYFNRYPD